MRRWERILSLIATHPRWVLASLSFLTLLAVAQIVDLRTGALHLVIDPSLNRLLPVQDPARDFYDDVRQRFGSDETLLVALVADDVFSPPNLSKIVRMSERFAAEPGIDRVVSLSTALDFRSEEGDLVIDPFLGEETDDPAEAARLRQAVLANPIYAGNLVSRDGRAAAFLIYPREMSEMEFERRGIDEKILEIAEEERGDAEIWITGAPRIKAETSRTLLSDLRWIVPLVLLLTSIVSAVSFRTVRGVVIPVVTILLGLVWTLGIIAWSGRTLNLVTTILPPLLLTIGYAYAVHILSEYSAVLREADPGSIDSREAARRALLHDALPVALTAVTTAVGFASLTISRLIAIREFGVFSIVGVTAILVASLTFIPAVLAMLPLPKKLAESAQGGRFDEAADAVARFDLRRRNLVLALGLAVAAVSIWGMTRIRVSADLIGNFKPSNPVRTNFEHINDALQGSNPFYVVLESEERDTFKEPAVLREVKDLEDFLVAQPEVGGATSLVDYLEVVNRAFHDNDPAFLAIPERRNLVSQLFLFGASDDLDRFVDRGFQTAVIIVRGKVIDSAGFSALKRRIEERLEQLPDELRGTVTGNTVLVIDTVDDISRGQIESLSIAFFAIYLILSALFTSFRTGLVALIPNALPVAIYFGALGLSGLTLNTTTGLVACIVLGIAVDDTIHYIARFSAESRRRADEHQGTIAAVVGVARPATLTSVALVLGFLTLTFSNLTNQIEFGALAAFTLAAAWLLDVTLTPALCSRLRIVTLWDVLTLDLGPDPHLSIPLLAGLSRPQARIAALLTDVRDIPAGYILTREGEPGDEMYVVVRGSLEATLDSPDGRVRLATMQRGDVIGEVALFYGKRTANVEALTDCRLLRLTTGNLERLRRRYPRIASHLFQNLSGVLATRLARVTPRAR